MGGGRDKGVEVKYLLVITDRLSGGGGGGKKPHLGSLHDSHLAPQLLVAVCFARLLSSFWCFSVHSPRARCLTWLKNVRPAGLKSSL